MNHFQEFYTNKNNWTIKLHVLVQQAPSNSSNHSRHTHKHTEEAHAHTQVQTTYVLRHLPRHRSRNWTSPNLVPQLHSQQGMGAGNASWGPWPKFAPCNVYHCQSNTSPSSCSAETSVFGKDGWVNSPAVFKWKNISVIAFLVLRCLQVSVGGSSKSGSVRSKGLIPLLKVVWLSIYVMHYILSSKTGKVISAWGSEVWLGNNWGNVWTESSKGKSRSSPSSSSSTSSGNITNAYLCLLQLALLTKPHNVNNTPMEKSNCRPHLVLNKGHAKSSQQYAELL